ncbi:MAG: DNA-binding protein [Candidatus Margulisbacteria bacterium]|jgi:hypothetical protein|nr:DNA-binding protein [Candidatus Margulisiibacteriota bacterium]
MRKAIFIFMLTVWAFAAREYSSGALLNLPREYDNIPVLYRGEVIGDIMPRGENVWFNVSDGGHAIGIFAPRELAAKIRVAGRYQQTGDTVEILGEFHRACAKHGGDLDIHATEITVLNPGFAAPQAVDKNKIILAGVLSGLALVLYFWHRRLK